MKLRMSPQKGSRRKRETASGAMRTIELKRAFKELPLTDMLTFGDVFGPLLRLMRLGSDFRSFPSDEDVSLLSAKLKDIRKREEKRRKFMANMQVPGKPRRRAAS